MYLFCARLKTSLVAGVTGDRVEMSPSVPRANALAHVKELCASRPCEKRLVALACNESYQLFPSGDQCMLVMLLNCGNGRSACATLAVGGNPGYGKPPNPRPAAI